MPGVGAHIAELAKKSPNFHFLVHEDLVLASLGASAEQFLYSQPDLTLVRARQFAEQVVKWACARAGLNAEKGTLQGRIGMLVDAGALHSDVIQVLHKLRIAGNVGVHEYYAERRDALEALQQCFVVASWRVRTETGDRTVRAFTPPPRPSDEPEPGSAADRAALSELNEQVEEYRQQLVATHEELLGAQSSLNRAEQARQQAEEDLAQASVQQEQWRHIADQLSDQLDALVADRDAEKQPRVTAGEREDFIKRSRRAGEPPLTEAQVRERLDKTLRTAGWVVQDKNEKNLYAGPGVAVREIYTKAGYADYLLYVDNGKLVGVIEAKREGEDLSAAQKQASDYAESLTAEQQLASWRPNLPFQYVTDGNETRFRNELDPKPRSRRVFAVHQPATVARWVREAEENWVCPTLRARLQLLPDLPLDETSLRAAQHRAITGLEKSWARNDPRALIQMTMGAGKTYAAASFGYRFLKHAKGKRILFLVDRNSLGDQAQAEFENFTTPDTGRKFKDLYNVDRMSGQTVLDSAHVVVSTIQRLWLGLTGRSVPDADDCTAEDELDGLPEGPAEVGYNAGIAPEAFDLIVIDECHRSIYGKWRAVLEYFDAYLVGLTATPVPETYGFFERNLVSEYTYEESVADGVNVPFEVYRIGTEIGEKGGTISAGTVVSVRDTKTRRERMEDLADDYVYSAAQEGRKVISKDRLRKVIDEFRDKLFTHIFPPVGDNARSRSEVPKTLIFGRTDEHAEEIVDEVRKAFGEGDAFCQKITSKAPHARDRLKEFRNSAEMRIAVTVDMIATGTDVRPLECVLFLREPKTWSLFEQMKGRGARTLDAAELQRVTPDVEAKTHFVIVDAVGVTDSPRPETRPLEKFSERQISLDKLLSKVGSLTLNTDEVSTLASRLSKLGRQISEDEKQELSELAEQPFEDVTKGLHQAADPDKRVEVHEEAVDAAGGDESAGDQAVKQLLEDAARPLAERPELRERVLQVRRSHDMVIDNHSLDRITASHGLTAEERAQQIVSSFRDYLRTHDAEIAAFDVAFRERRSPHEVYAKLRELAKRMEKPPHQWTPQRLIDAYDKLGQVSGNAATTGLPDLIGILRCELGLDEHVRPYRQIVEEHFEAWLLRQQQQGRTYTEEQRWWLDQVVEAIAKNITIEVDDFGHKPLSDRGGTQGFVAAFGHDQAQPLLDELNQELSA